MRPVLFSADFCGGDSSTAAMTMPSAASDTQAP
jgi:hypothetical protein